MPTDSGSHHESDRDRDRDRDGERGDRGGSKQKASSSKSKDLSHVPCKFYKVGGCTAGSSCPFSHSSVEPGAQKETCTWFIKGNCKFGHKCALAHVLPGQSMAMDRKNKKAAQTAAAGASAEKGGKLGNGARGGARREATSNAPGANRLPLLAGGATAPTRIMGGSGPSSSGRPPMTMPLKATISPSAPAPPLKDTDFTSFATLEAMENVLPSTETSSKQEGSPTEEGISEHDAPDVSAAQNAPKPSTHAVPVSASRPPTNHPVSNDFGPIGSPPNYRSGQPTSPRVNGGAFSPGTSPRAHTHINGVNISGSPSANSGAAMLSTSPFSAPGTQSVFLSSSYSTGGGMAASLGSGLAMMGGRKGWGDSDASASVGGPNSFSGLLSAQLSSSVSQQRSTNGFGSRNEYDINIEYDEFGGVRDSRGVTRGAEIAVEDEDLEDFLPSSLNDLLTPAERSRRMSRSNSGQPSGVSQLTNALANANTDSGNGPTTGNSNSGLGHRYSRSVPAPTLLGDIKSIWADTSAPPLPSSPPTHRGTPSAGYGARFDPYASNVLGDEAGLSMSMGSAGTASSIGMMSPSNASAAFLPAQLGLGGIGRQMRGASNPLYPGPTAPVAAPNNSLANNYLQPLGGMGLPSSASSSSAFHTHTHGNTQTTYRTTPSPFDLTQAMHQNPQTSRPIPSNLANQKSVADDPLLAPHLLSPSSRALHAHAPGQSLPQGLAAGYSRIHALPPLTNIASPPTSGSFVPGTSPGANAAMNNLSNEAPYGDWPSANQNAGMGAAGTAGLETMFSRLSYSAATRSGPANAPGTPPGLSRNVSGGRYTQQQGAALSPLSGPVVTRDDDDLFDMDK
ncbi:hypothetical protein M413DRAFT_20364 [Hebeloma cylindrosporum]|uniref:C3H1-type domain-containing protein n=1 Tax=Hebeloma cylindrosporum TaxID=76867 RepID=A0A0C2XH51_HEBCY|nr:hypothetical protein M413DRAFT_20364 [Hebeloma cylindrosporum h7]